MGRRACEKGSAASGYPSREVVSPSLGRRGYNNAVRAGEPFTVCGGGLYEDAVATLTDAKGVEHPLAIELAKGLSMVCRADGSPAKGAATLTVPSSSSSTDTE